MSLKTMNFEIDVSGEDIFNDNYTIVVAEKNNESRLKGFKFSRELIQILRARHGQGKYRYPTSKQGKSLFRVRLYCIIIFHLFRNFNLGNNTEINLDICRDFQGREKDINSNLKFLLEKVLKLKINSKRYVKMEDSIADKYAYLMRKDSKNLINGYINLDIEEIEKYLK